MSMSGGVAACALGFLTALCAYGCDSVHKQTTSEVPERVSADSTLAEPGSSATQQPAGERANAPQRLSPGDHFLDGYPAMHDTSALRRVFGEPDSMHTLDDPNQWLSIWWYHNLTIYLASREFVVGFGLAGAGAATARGLRVGDSEERVLALYGEPDETEAGRWTYRFDEDSPHRGVAEQGIRVWIRDGHVEYIRVGMLVLFG